MEGNNQIRQDTPGNPSSDTQNPDKLCDNYELYRTSACLSDEELEAKISPRYHVYLLRISPYVRKQAIQELRKTLEIGDSFFDLLKIFDIIVSDKDFDVIAEEQSKLVCKEIGKAKVAPKVAIMISAIKNILEQQYPEKPESDTIQKTLYPKDGFSELNPAIEIVDLGVFIESDADEWRKRCITFLKGMCMMNCEEDDSTEMLQEAGHLLRYGITKGKKHCFNPLKNIDFSLFKDDMIEFKNPANVKLANPTANNLFQCELKPHDNTPDTICQLQSWCDAYQENINDSKTYCYSVHRMNGLDNFKNCHKKGFCCRFMRKTIMIY